MDVGLFVSRHIGGGSAVRRQPHLVEVLFGHVITHILHFFSPAAHVVRNTPAAHVALQTTSLPAPVALRATDAGALVNALVRITLASHIDILML